MVFDTLKSFFFSSLLPSQLKETEGGRESLEKCSIGGREKNLDKGGASGNMCVFSGFFGVCAPFLQNTFDKFGMSYVPASSSW